MDAADRPIGDYGLIGDTRTAALVASNFDYTTGTTDSSIFHDNNQVTVDNNPLSPFYGRIYVTHVKFHIQPNGFSDYCPVQLDYTDYVPTFNPRLTTFHHTAVAPDQPGPGDRRTRVEQELPRRPGSWRRGRTLGTADACTPHPDQGESDYVRARRATQVNPNGPAGTLKAGASS